ncbi:hypothetical protein [Muriicola sp. Z0-33]|uniref:hypothetical protein n=1 Tax=Muriicola sp. Z0-33 TaxID=2816957 RepID=UPI002238F5B1|nr:hypothetical protein [Muriicola sp. Z0-33]MCW5515286.1 hypothetical protein [Muriicola sp. Z0-33]
MKINSIFFLATLLFLMGCYDPSEDLTSIDEFQFNLIESRDSLIADGFSSYNFVVKLPGVKYGDSKEVTLKSTWGLWPNDSTSAKMLIEYNSNDDAYVDTIKLKASRTAGPFTIQVNEGSDHLRTEDFESIPQLPSFVQVISDSIKLKLTPGNSTKLRALFFNNSGFPSDNTKFIFYTDADVTIFPREVYIESSETTATLQISTETKVDTIKVYGEIPALGLSQPIIDTLKIAIIN